MTTEREIGTVKRFDPERGFGFNARRGADDVFVHQTDIDRAGLGTLCAGERVCFTLERTMRGYQARNLTRADPVAQQAEPARSVARPDTVTDFQFGPNYLRGGYFEEKDGKHYLRPEILDTLAMDVARVLGNRSMKSHQLRRFFNKARGIETSLGLANDFEAIKADIYGFKRDVAYQVGRRVVPEEFQQFINRNVELAVEDEQSFRRGFLQHFESVLAYFVYFFHEQ